MSRNGAVTKAYDVGTYTDSKGNEWRRGMDGWFLEGTGDIFLIRHGDMVAMIEEENPE